MSTGDKVRVRIAPSPTGSFHVGNAQSALYNWLFARKHGGNFYLRIEDTDIKRSIIESERGIINALNWLSLNWSGKVVRQSEHKTRHRKELERLIASGKAFWCNHTKEELEAERREQETKKEPPRHLCNHRHHKFFYPITSPENTSWIIRLAVDQNIKRKISFNDIIRGPIEFDARLLGDFSIAKSFDEPLYNFAVVVDDSDMKISHVIRGEDHISNTPKQILIYEALGFPIPQFAHLPLILGPDRSKLSKRHGGTSTADYQKDYLSEAVINFLGNLGFTFSKEIISKEEMAEEFDLAKVHKSGAVFDIKKLNWINSQYIKKLAPQEFKNLTGLNISDSVVPLITERLEKLSDAREFSYLWQEPEYEKELLSWKGTAPHLTRESLERVLGVMENWDFQDPEVVRHRLDSVAGTDRGLVYWPLRVALSGREKSPDPVQIAVVLGKDEVIRRVGKAIDLLK